MTPVKIKQDPAVQTKFESYPPTARKKIEFLRALILKTAEELEEIREVGETLKWGEPSYLVKKGSTLRIDWKPKNPNQYAMYFNCNTSLVETFKFRFGDLFKYEKNRALLFELEEQLPVKELQECIEMALQYHSLKNKPFLGK